MKNANTNRLLFKTIIILFLSLPIVFSSCKKEEEKKEDDKPIIENKIADTAFVSKLEFTGNDSVQYVLGMIAPASPKIGVNDFKAALYKKVSGTTTRINNYKIKLDPRMTGMGNHGSPNNVDATQNADGKYYGKLNFTMTGYWKINLLIENASGDIIKGEAITGSVKSSSIFFEIEF